MVSVFDFAVILENCETIKAYITEYRSSFNSEVQEWLLLLTTGIGEMQEVSLKFQAQLRNLFLQDASEEQIQERIKAASIFFKSKLQDITGYLVKSPAVTDSRIHAKEYNDSIKEIFAQLSLKKHLVQGFENGFNLENHQQRKRSFVLPAFAVNSYATASQQRTESPHPALHQQLRKLRDSICAKKDLPVYFVVTGKTLDEMTLYLPQTLEELQKISGFGKAKIESYGQQFLDIILAYSQQWGLIFSYT